MEFICSAKSYKYNYPTSKTLNLIHEKCNDWDRLQKLSRLVRNDVVLNWHESFMPWELLTKRRECQKHVCSFWLAREAQYRTFSLSYVLLPHYRIQLLSKTRLWKMIANCPTENIKVYYQHWKRNNSEAKVKFKGGFGFKYTFAVFN